MDKRQKALNYAFYLSIVLVILNSVFLLFIPGLSLSQFGYIEIPVFPMLGYLTKRGNYKASFALLIFFIVDRIVVVVNWSDHITPLGFASFLFISFAIWQVFYKAFYYLKSKP